MTIQEQPKLKCEVCKKPTDFIKAGKAWSGRHRVQRYQCQECGHITSVRIEKEEALPIIRDEKTGRFIKRTPSC